MNFFSSALNLLSISSLPYTIKEKVVDPQGLYPQNRLVWAVYNGVNPKNSANVSIFEFNLKDPASQQYVGLARNAYKKLKGLKFPGIIGVVDFIDNESYLYIVTERVTPLWAYLASNSGEVSNEARLAGVHSILLAVKMINTLANSLVALIDPLSLIYVTALGEWRLFSFELLTNLTSDPDQPIYRLSASSPLFGQNEPPEVSSKGTEAIRGNPFSYDAYKMGVLIVSVVSSDLQLPIQISRAALGTSASLAQKLQISKSFATQILLLFEIQKNRPLVEQFLASAEAVFEANPIVEFTRLLDDLKFKSDAEKLAFCKNVVPLFLTTKFPPGYLDHKVVPELVLQYHAVSSQKPVVGAPPEDHQTRQEAVAILLNHILQLGESLPPAVFSAVVNPVLFHAYTLPDRAVRLCLLKCLPGYCAGLTESDVQAKIFPHLLTGFQDTNFLIRETTLTSITAIIDKVSTKQVNQELLRVLAKLQMDPKPLIRTNTLILIIKIAPQIYRNSRNSVVITALAKSLRDSFIPCKMAALSGFEKLIDTFSLDEICLKILGHLAVSLMDPKSAKVRQELKRVFQLYLDSVEKHAATLPEGEEDEDAEEKEFYKKMGEPAPTTTSQSLGWNVVNKLVATGELDQKLNRSTPDLTRVSTPKLDQWEQPGWLDEEDIYETTPEVPKLSLASERARPLALKAKAAKPKPVAKPQRAPGLTLKLDLELDEEDSWGGDW